MATRLGNAMTNVISVCDREADICDYLIYKIANQQRFVVRSMMSRHIEEGSDKLYRFASKLRSVVQRKPKYLKEVVVKLVRSLWM